MFSFFQRKKVVAGPHEFSAETEIACSAEDLFALVDIADDRFWKAQMGDRIEPLGDDKYRMTAAMAPDMDIVITRTQVEPGRMVEIEPVCTPRPGRLESASERYEIVSTGPGHARLELHMEVMFQDAMTEQVFAEESVMMSIAAFNTVEKIRLFAESGQAAVAHADQQFIVGLDRAAVN